MIFAFVIALSISQFANKIDARVGVAAYDIESGRSFTYNADESFPNASVFKLPLAIEVLHRGFDLNRKYTLTPADFSLGHSPIRDNAKGAPVTLTMRELIRAAVSESDNTAGDYLLKLVTPAAVTKRAESLGAKGIRVDRPERDIIPIFREHDGAARYARDPRDTSTPNAVVALLRALYQRREQYALLMTFLTKSNNPVRIGKLLPAGVKVAHKTGTMPGTMNDVGIVTSPDGKHHIAIAIFTKAAQRSSEEERERVIAEIARAIYDARGAGVPPAVGARLARRPE